MPAFDSETAVAALPTGRLWALLGQGQPQQRVWSAWNLAARGGPHNVHGLTAAFDRDPCPGVRRHLLVVLASLGQHDVVRRTAAHEPNAEVRATATRYLARLAEPDDDAGYDLLVARKLDLAWKVRYCVADALRADAPDAVLEVMAGLVFDTDRDVREAMRRRIHDAQIPRWPFEAALRTLEAAEAKRAAEPKSRPRPSTALVRRQPRPEP